MAPKREAFTCDGVSSTYEEVAVRTTRLAWRLRELGVRHGDRVAYLGPNHPSFAETMFAAHQLGAIFVPLNFRLTPAEINYQLADCGAHVLVHAPSHQVEHPRAVSLAAYEDWLLQGSGEPLDEPVGADDIALILYTSGTTGRPKGAMLSHANLLWNTFNLMIGVDIASDDVALVSAPLFHVAALAQTLLPTFAKGGRSVITSRWDVAECVSLIETQRVTWMFGVSTMYADLAASSSWHDADLSSLRVLLCGGAAVPDAVIRAYQDRGLVFCQGYGLTETAPGATFLEAADSVRKAGSAGPPVFFGDLRLAGTGEIEVEGPNVTPGYWNDPVATAAAFTSDGWFRTGDLGRLDDGHLYVLDRLKDMYISGGENVYPAEVENAITSHPDVAEVAVVGVPDQRWGEVGRAFVRPRDGAVVDAAGLREFLLPRLAKYKIPVHVEVVAELPRTGSGKVLKPALRRLPL
ncbi:acyl-CoA synthetase [Lentzea sp. NEAU-D7]|uniref:acyl-CoA synthetase n=1 Tax=Lentzea sp. NEAU-D7 TaxID=2994667 RepID=UPI00224B5ABA|nr:long-chain fatty acid--CoA ligase [Lentzea sp. NEAU-D7]MCX2948765.1 long-chain fatty acid--CoA ligase [Lentzea sp. NEAU-D7]MCX2951323.1 long-chain fatty acid--CoA ligase [Lentzea sp. NEAU-D7]